MRMLLLITTTTLLASVPLVAQRVDTVQARATPVWGTTPTIREELRIGMLDGPEEYTFGRITGVSVRGDGTILVLDAQIPLIRQYSPDGTFVRNIGRGGEGPGEYRETAQMLVLPDGRLAVWDSRNTRITTYDTTGQFQVSHRVPLTTTRSESFFVDTAGIYGIKVTDFMTPGAANPEDLRLFLVRVSSTGEIIDSLGIPPERRTWPSFVLATPEGYRWSFPDATLHALSPHGYLITAQNRTYALDLHLEGYIRRILRDAESVRIAGPERRQWEAWARFFEKGPDTPRFPSLPRTKPFLRRLFVDADARIWAERYVEAKKHDVEPRAEGDERPLYEWREPPTFDVFEPSGRFLGTIELPPDHFFYQARGFQIWATAAGSVRESYVVRLRIDPSD